MSQWNDPPERAEMRLLISFVDLTRFTAETRRRPNVEIATAMDEMYRRIGAAIAAAGGRLVKFIGDASLIVFAEDGVDRGVIALLALKEELDDYFRGLGWECRAAVKIHVGTAVAGPYGLAGTFDVLGNDVNTCATIHSPGVALSVEAFRGLSADLRRRFKKHTPPVCYIRTEDPRPFRYTAR
jgi:class 3 adenylate cyclase